MYIAHISKETKFITLETAEAAATLMVLQCYQPLIVIMKESDEKREIRNANACSEHKRFAKFWININIRVRRHQKCPPDCENRKKKRKSKKSRDDDQDM